MNLKPIASWIALLVAPACVRADDLYYRVFRGFKQPTVDALTLPSELASKFLPEAPRVMVKHSLVSYVPALPPRDKPAGIPDEIAIVVYGSGAAYEAGVADPARKAYGDLHWVYFENPKTGRTRSDTAKPYARALASESPVDVLGGRPDWQAGYTTVFVGTRREDVPAGEFLERLSEHVARARDHFPAMGLDGYIVVANPDSEIAWMHWSSGDAARAALASPAGTEIRESGAKLMTRVMWSAASEFRDRFDYNSAVTVPFEPWRP